MSTITVSSRSISISHSTQVELRTGRGSEIECRSSMLIDLVDIAWLIAGDNVSERRGRLGGSSAVLRFEAEKLAGVKGKRKIQTLAITMKNTKLALKLLAAVATISIEVTDAFAFNRRFSHKSHELSMQVDVAGIIKAALSTSNKFGVASYKAIIAWKPIEEIEYNVDASERAVDETRYDDTLRIEDYETLLQKIKPLLDKQESKTGKMKSIANEIKVSSLHH